MNDFLPTVADALSNGNPPLPLGFFVRWPDRNTSRKREDGETTTLADRALGRVDNEE
jgi:hypothetical protein